MRSLGKSTSLGLLVLALTAYLVVVQQCEAISKLMFVQQPHLRWVDWDRITWSWPLHPWKTQWMLTIRIKTYRFCYQPGDQMINGQSPPPISTQCVYCNKNQFDHTLFKCTGISAYQQSINTTQAFCIITHCLEQIRNQTPVLLG